MSGLKGVNEQVRKIRQKKLKCLHKMKINSKKKRIVLVCVNLLSIINLIIDYLFFEIQVRMQIISTFG
jgi:hypothetical protein